jgi:zinc protease
MTRMLAVPFLFLGLTPLEAQTAILTASTDDARTFVQGNKTVTVSAPVRIGDDVTTFTLDNGMEVVVIEDHRAPVVVQMVWYRAGSADEKVGQSGVAHFLEHLLFKGTDKLAPASSLRPSRRMVGPTTPLPATITPPISNELRQIACR